MAVLEKIVREWQQELRNGVAWVAFWKEGPSWDARCVYLDDNDLLVAEDTSALEEAIQKDPHAVVLNSYYCGQLAEDMTVNELAAGVRHHYEQGTNSLVDFLFEHKNLMSDLYEKVSKEQEQYESWLLDQKPSAILDHSYDYVVREDIVAVLGDGDFVLGNSQAKALLSFPDTLSYLQNEYERSDSNTLGRTWEIVEATAMQTDGYLGDVVGAIDDFCKKNYHRGADISSLEKVLLVDTTISSNKVHLQVIADLVNFRIRPLTANGPSANTGIDEVDTMFDNLIGFVGGVARVIGIALVIFGVVSFGIALANHDPGQRAQGLMALAGGVVVFFAPNIITFLQGM